MRHAVDARRNPAMRRRAILEGTEHAAELVLEDIFAVASDRKGLTHHVGAMVADRTGGQFDAIANNVVLDRPYL